MKKLLLLLFAAWAFVASASAAEVVVVSHEPGYYTSLARHLERWLHGQSIPTAFATPKEMAASLQSAKLAFLVGFNEPSAAELETLATYRKRGGKLVVFYSASPRLAALMEQMGRRPIEISFFTP